MTRNQIKRSRETMSFVGEGEGALASPATQTGPQHARKLRKTWLSAAMLVAAGLAIAIGHCTANAGSVDGERAGDSPQRCAAQYAAMLDLAELARRDGKSAAIVVRGLSEGGGVMRECFADGERLRR
jgi:hypothetical protein